MAKQKSGQPSMSSYWRNLFLQNPKLVKIRSNSALREQWEKDHPGQKFDESWSQALSNVKSLMRKRRKRGGAKAAANGAAEAPAPVNVPAAALERLEEAVDRCLWTARGLDAVGLERAIKHLHAARNEIVWKSSRKHI
jgi:hypothetical protein